MATIYALTDPRDGSVRYIGKTTQTLSARLRTHRYAAKRMRDTSAKGDWIRELQEVGLRPEITRVCESDDRGWKEAERRVIREYRDAGHRLLNVFRGGNGSHRIKRRIDMTPALKSRLGKEPDAILAEELGVTRKAITYHRRSRGIPASFDRTRNVPPPPMGGHNRIELPDDIVARLGTMSDAALAAVAGVSKKRIVCERHRRGIASCAERTGNTGRFKPGHYPSRWLKKP